MSFTRPYVLRISARMATSPNQQGGVGAASGAIWMWTEACVILRGYSPFKLTYCLVDLLRRHLFLSFYNASPLLSTFFLISPAYWYLVAQLVGTGTKSGVLERAARRIKRFCLNPFFGRSEKGPIILNSPSCVNRILDYLAEGKFVFIDMLNQSDENYTLVAALFARRLLTRNKLQDDDEDHIRACIVMEEAHNILSEEELSKGNGRGSVFIELAREGRSFKLGFMLVTQQPDVRSIDLQVIKTIDTVVAFNMPFDDAKHIQRLKSGFAGLELEISI